MLVSASRRRNRRSFKRHNQPITKSQRKTTSSLYSGPAAEAEVRQTALPAGQRCVQLGLGNRRTARSTAEAGGLSGTEGGDSRKRGRERGRNTPASKQQGRTTCLIFFFFHFDQLLNLPRASYEKEGRWQQGRERQ